MKKSLYVGALIALIPFFAHSKCVEDYTDTRGVLANLIAALKPVPPGIVPTCDSLRLVLGKLSNNPRVGGRKLEGERPFDEAVAQKDLAMAYRSQDIRGRIEKIHREVKDENARLALEAAVLDEEGYYGGRDLLIKRLLQQVR